MQDYYYIGIDIGGTFTDAFLMSESGLALHSKTPTTPSDLSTGVMNCVELLAKQLEYSSAKLLKKAAIFSHGTTVTLNALIQYRGVKTGLITTKGFRDHMYLMRSGRSAGLPDSEILDMNRVSRPPPIVPIKLTEEVTERVDRSGTVIVPLDKREMRASVRRLIQQGTQAIAVSFLWAFKNPTHESVIKEYIRKNYPNVFVTCSNDLAPVMGEYERTTTTVLNCYLGPILNKYVNHLVGKLNSEGLRSRLFLMQSSGGVIPAEEASNMTITTLSSGLAGGVMGSHYLGTLTGYRNIITTDMGGTSFEVGLVVDGSPLYAEEAYTPKFGSYFNRYRLRVTSIDVTAIGSGGGSIAWVDHGLVRVGPLSAAADPGPACYVRGGEKPTVTDADLILGYLNPDYFLGGSMKLSFEKAHKAVKENIAGPMGLDVADAAKGITEVANSQEADLIRSVVIERGYDPKDFVLFAYGGAGPMHCSSYGAELGIPIVIPHLAAAHSAFGIVVSDIKQSFALSDPVENPDANKVNENFRKLDERAVKTLTQWGLKAGTINLIRGLDMRFRAQVHELTVPVEKVPLTEKDLKSLFHRFHEQYEARYGQGTAYPQAGIEIVTYRIEAIVQTAKPTLKRFEKSTNDRVPIKSRRNVFFPQQNDFVTTNVFDGVKLNAGNIIPGPAVIEMPDTTIVVQPSQKLEVDEYLNVIIMTT